MKQMYRLFAVAGALCLSVGLCAQNLRPMANEKGKFGYVDENGEKVISYKYTEAYPFEEGLAKVRKGDKYGFINPEGKAVGKIKYTLILPFTGSYCRVAVGGKYKDGILTGEKWGFLNKRGEEILPPEYDEIGEFEDGTTYVRKGKKYGLINEQIEFLLEPKNVAVGMFDKFGYCWFATSGKVDKKSGKLMNGRYGLINKAGKIIIPAKYAVIGYFYKYRVKGSQDVQELNAANSIAYNLYSLERPLSRLYNPENILKVDLSQAKSEAATDTIMLGYENMEIFTDSTYFIFGKSRVRNGVMNAHGDVMVPDKKFDYVHCPAYGIALVGKIRKKKVNYGYYNVESGFLKEFEDNEILQSYIDGVGKIVNADDQSVYFVDKSGNRVTEVYRAAMNFNQGRCIVQDNKSGKFGVIDTEGKALLPFEYDDIHPSYGEGLLGVRKSDLWGAVNLEGEMTIPLAYTGLTQFKSGWAAACDKDGHWGLIDKDNRTIVPFQWDDVLLGAPQDVSLVWVKKNNLWQCYDRKKQALAFDKGFESAWNFQDGRAMVSENQKLGVVDVNGNLIVPCQLNSQFKVDDVLAYMKQTGRQSLTEIDTYRLNLQGDETVNSFQITDQIPEDMWDY